MPGRGTLPAWARREKASPYLYEHHKPGDPDSSDVGSSSEENPWGDLIGGKNPEQMRMREQAEAMLRIQGVPPRTHSSG